MSFPSVDQYVRSVVTYFSVIAEENEVPAAAQRRFGVRTFVDWTKNGASVEAREAELAAQSSFMSFEVPANIEMRGLGVLQQGQNERHFDCRKVEVRVFLVSLIAARPNRIN